MLGLHLIGINHRSTNLELREQVMFVPNLISRAYQSIQSQCEVQEVLLISTCARTECIVVSNDIDKIKLWLANFHNINFESLENQLIHLQGRDVVTHLMRVASGIDSFIIGETQVLGQLKKAFSVAEKHGTVGALFYRLFPAVFAIAKQIRSKTNIGGKSISLASAITLLAKEIFVDLSSCRVMLIGAGEMIHLAATHLYANGVRSWIMANRTIEKAQTLASAFSGQDIIIEEIHKYLDKVDIVVTATASPVPLIGKGLIERIQRQRLQKSLFLADLAMPRDIEPEVQQISGVYLYHLDNLQNLIQENIKKRSEAVLQAEPMVHNACERFIQEQNSIKQIKLIRDFRDHVKSIQDKALLDAISQINLGLDPGVVVTNTMNNFYQKLIHAPTVNLRRAARNHDYEFLRFASEIFNVNHEKE